MTTNDDASVPGALPPAGWLRDPAGQTRWWDGTRWTEHVQPTADPPAYGAVFGSDPRARVPNTSTRNGPATAALILILVNLLMGAIAFLIGLFAASAGFSVSYIGLLLLGGVLAWLVLIAAFVLAIIATVIAVRRPTRKREAVFALVASSVFLIFAIGRSVVAAGLL